MKSFFLQINIRQLIIHFIAFWLFIYGVHTLASLYDYTFLYTDFALQTRVIFKPRFTTDMFIIKQGGNVGLIIAYIISYQIAVKRKWFWANSVIVLLVTFGLYYFDLLGWKSLKTYALQPGHMYINVNSKASVITSGVVMLAIGSFLFFKKQVTTFIDKGVWHEKKAPQPRVAKASLKQK